MKNKTSQQPTGKDLLKQFGVEILGANTAKANFGLMPSGHKTEGQTAAFTLEVGEIPEEYASNEEFLVKPWRLLSKACTPYRFFDFSQGEVLKNAVALFADKTLYTNHTPDVNNWKGFVKAPWWDEDNTPPGINGLMVIDRTIDSRLARGVEIGALRSASVTVWFEFKRSHPDLRNFYDYLGTEVDGEVVRFIVTKITNCGEVSIVWEGEDPFAKSLAAGGGDQPNSQGEDNMKFSKQFLEKLGIDAAGEPSAEDVEQKTLAALQTLTEENTTLAADAKVGKQYLATTRAEAVTLYKTLKGDQAKQSFVTNVLEKADLETATAFLEEYRAELDKSVPLNCPKCGEKLSRRSSTTGDGQHSFSGRNPEHYKVSS